MRFEITGMDEVKKIFANLSEIDRRKFFIDEFKPVARLVEVAMKNQTPVSGRNSKSKRYESRSHVRGTLRNSIGSKVGGSTIPVVWINLNRKRGVDAWYDHIVVGGHTYNGATVPENPIVQRTWDAIGGMVAGQLESRIKNKLTAMLR